MTQLTAVLFLHWVSLSEHAESLPTSPQLLQRRQGRTGADGTFSLSPNCTLVLFCVVSGCVPHALLFESSPALLELLPNSTARCTHFSKALLLCAWRQFLYFSRHCDPKPGLLLLSLPVSLLISPTPSELLKGAEEPLTSHIVSVRFINTERVIQSFYLVGCYKWKELHKRDHLSIHSSHFHRPYRGQGTCVLKIGAGPKSGIHIYQQFVNN